MKTLLTVFVSFLIPLIALGLLWNLGSGRHFWSVSEAVIIAGVLAFMAKPFVVWLASQKPG